MVDTAAQAGRSNGATAAAASASASASASANPNLGKLYELGPGIRRRVASSYQREPGDPLWRPLRIFTGDPALQKLDGKTSTVRVPYERLRRGVEGRKDGQIRGQIFNVSMQDSEGRVFAAPSLDDDRLLMQEGHAPSEANPKFHAQMVYAVASLVHSSFRQALGREIGWSFGGDDEATPLTLLPFGALHEANAWYDPAAGEIRFGAFQPQNDDDGDAGPIPTGWVFTALSHDVIAHEVTHALVDGLRPHFLTPSSCDVAGFHEGMADLVALFHHFKHPQALRAALAKSRGRIEAAEYLYSIAQQFGQADGRFALRSAIVPPTEEQKNGCVQYTPTMEEHDMGAVLMAAVFEAFCNVYRRKTAQLLRVATGGSGQLPAGELPADLLDMLANKASELASQFLLLMIRALDYCPPCDVKLGEFLRAMVTADAQMVLDDRWGYREALIDAFRRRGIYPKNVLSLSEDSLLWQPPAQPLGRIEALSFSNMRFNGDPGAPLSVAEQIQQAMALGEALAQGPMMQACGLVKAGDPRLKGAKVSLPRIESVRTVRRAAPDHHIAFETVAEISQTCRVSGRNEQPGFEFVGGATLILSAAGDVRFIISKSVGGQGRIDSRRSFLTGHTTTAKRFWLNQNGVMRLHPNWCRQLHGSKLGTP